MVMPELIYLQHEVREYPGCSKRGQEGWCKGIYKYPYYRGSDRKYYCEDCARKLVHEHLGKFGSIKDDRYCPRCKGTGRVNA